jgi:uncharacterized membrane protein YjfL (UPF0719 family)
VNRVINLLIFTCIKLLLMLFVYIFYNCYLYFKLLSLFLNSFLNVYLPLVPYERECEMRIRQRSAAASAAERGSEFGACILINESAEGVKVMALSDRCAKATEEKIKSVAH